MIFEMKRGLMRPLFCVFTSWFILKGGTGPKSALAYLLNPFKDHGKKI